MKKLIIMLIGITCIMLVTAGIGVSLLPEKDIDAEVLAKSKTTLDALGSNDIQRSQLDCDGTTCSQKMWKVLDDGRTYNLGSVRINQKECTEFSGEVDVEECVTYSEKSDVDLIAEADTARVKRLDGIAEAIAKRAEVVDDAKSVEGAGKITLKDKVVIK